MNNRRVFLALISLILISGCSTRGKNVYNSDSSVATQNYSENSSDYSATPEKKKYVHPTMRSYVVRGVRYHPTVVSVGDKFVGNASWYGPKFHGKTTSSGEKYNMYKMSAAHKTLPMNTIVKVTNRRNGRSTVVRINDRGPFVSTRIIDLSQKAAKEIDMIAAGTAPVTIEVLGFETHGKKTIPTAQEMKKSVQAQSVNNFALQIASFTKVKGALITQEKYDNIDGYRTIIKDTKTEKGRFFKVWLRGFKSEQEARDYKDNGRFSRAFIVMEE